MCVRYLLLLCALGLWLAPECRAQMQQRLSLADAIRLTQANNPLTQGAQARVVGANARLRGAGALSSPVLLLAPHLGDNTGGLDEDMLLTQTIELGDKRRQRVYSARAE